MITTLLCCLFSMTALAQTDYSRIPLRNNRYGSYMMEWNKPTESLMIKNAATGNYVKQMVPFKGKEVFLDVVLIQRLQGMAFLLEQNGYCSDFDGLVSLSLAWIKDPETGKERHARGIFKIEDECLKPLIMTTDLDRIKITHSNVFVEYPDYEGYEEYRRTKKNKKLGKKLGGTTFIYDSNFKEIKKVEGCIDKVKYNGKTGYIAFELNNGGVDTLYLPIGYVVFNDNAEKYGVKDDNGNIVLPCVLSREEVDDALSTMDLWSFKSYSRELVAKKSDFETQAEYEARRNNPELQQQYVVSKGLDKKYYKPYRISLGKYDAETETFPINGFMAFMRGEEPVVVNIPWNDFRISIPRAEAEDFYNNFGNLNKEALNNATMCVRYDAPAIQEITFNGADGKTYHWQRQ